MDQKLPGIINYLIATGLMTYFLFFLKRKSVEEPQKKISGFSIKTLIVIAYVGIVLDIAMIIITLLK